MRLAVDGPQSLTLNCGSFSSSWDLNGIKLRIHYLG